MIAACVAEVRAWPSVKRIGNATKPVTADTNSSPRNRRATGRDWCDATRIGAAMRPARAVRRTATMSGSKSSTAILVTTGVEPQPTLTTTATRTASAAPLGAATRAFTTARSRLAPPRHPVLSVALGLLTRARAGNRIVRLRRFRDFLARGEAPEPEHAQVPRLEDLERVDHPEGGREYDDPERADDQ